MRVSFTWGLVVTPPLLRELLRVAVGQRGARLLAVLTPLSYGFFSQRVKQVSELTRVQPFVLHPTVEAFHYAFSAGLLERIWNGSIFSSIAYESSDD